MAGATRALFAIAAFVIAFLGSEGRAQHAASLPPAVVVVRHADTSPDIPGDRPLNAEGVRRSRDLLAALRNMRFDGVITTQLRRTRQTAQPLADAMGLAPEVVPLMPSQEQAHLRAIGEAIRKHKSGAVLVVGHSNTVPLIIQALGGPRVPQICETVFDNLFVLMPADGKVQLLHARYGAPSPPSGPGCP